MYIPEKMQVNKFQDVAIPANKLYFARLGQTDVPTSQFTGDEVAPMNQSKIDQIEAYRLYAEEEAKKVNEPEQ